MVSFTDNMYQTSHKSVLNMNCEVMKKKIFSSKKKKNFINKKKKNFITLAVMTVLTKLGVPSVSFTRDELQTIFLFWK